MHAGMRASGRLCHGNPWPVLASALFLLASHAVAEDLPKPFDPVPPSPETQVESLERSQRELKEQVDRLFQENEALTERVNVLHGSLGDGKPRKGLSLQSTEFEDQPPDIRTVQPAPKSSGATKSTFNEGFKWSTEDGEFTVNFHNETQLDTRAYTQAHSDPTNQFGFYIPRMRLIFNGRLTKPIEYNVSLNKGLGSLDLLDAYLNFNYDPRLQFRIGRYRVPFLYDWFALGNQFLTTPERSVFALNQGYNRNFAAMVHGELMDDRLDYAFAVANGPRNSYFDTNSSKDLLSYLNVRPFMLSERFSALKYLNLGGSFTWGIQDQSPLPVEFRTSANATESGGTFEAVPTFLELNDDVLEFGGRKLWELHFAYYYKQLSFMGALDGGYNGYLQTTTNTKVRVPTRGYHVQFGYFLTGEEVERRTFGEPLCPFDLRQGKRGWGAWELQARYDHFMVGNEVFSGGLADANLWTNQVNTIDMGVNWYLNKYVKIYFDWQHSQYANPVMYRPGGFTRTSDLFWIRTQVYF